MTSRSPVAAASAARAQPVENFRWFLSTTPGKALARMVVLVALAVIAVGASVEVIAHIKDSVYTIGISTEPSIVASQKARVQISDLDANTLNDTLGDGSASGTGADSAKDRASLTNVLIDATMNITFRDTETPAIRGIFSSLDMYNQAIGEARAVYRDDPWVGLQRVKWSSRILRGMAIPQADALEEANLQPLEAAYTNYTQHAWRLGIECIAAMLVLGAVMFNLQMFTARNSLLNLPVAAGLAVLTVTTCWLGYAVIAERNLTVSAKEDAFDSVRVLYEAKALAYQMNADESLWLVDSDPAGRAASQADFLATKAKLFGDTISADTITKLDAALKAELAGSPREAMKLTPQNLPGLLGKELNNITFGGPERQAATDVIKLLKQYIDVDSEIRRLELAGDHAGAVRLCIGNEPGQSNYVFSKFDATMDAILKVNSDEFDRMIASALSMIGRAPWVAFGGILLSVVLSLVGGARFYGEFR